MNEVLNGNTFVIKEQVGRLKATHNYDIYDPNTGLLVLECRQENIGLAASVLRFSKHQHRFPFDIAVKLPNGTTVLRIKRGASLLLSKIDVLGEAGEILGKFEQSLGGKVTKSLRVLDANDRPVYYLQGDGLRIEFWFKSEQTVYAQILKVTKRWERLTSSADNYVINIDPSVPPNSLERQLILASAICADMVFNQV